MSQVNEKQKRGKRNPQMIVKNAVDKALKSANLQSGLTPSILLKGYKDKDSENHKAIMGALKLLDQKVKSVSKNAISTGMLNKFALQKSNKQSFNELRNSLGEDAKGVSSKVLRELVALDDWGTIAKTAIPMLTQYGIPYLKRLYEKYVQPHMGGDEGINSVDWGGSALGPFRYTPADGVNTFGVGTKDKTIYDSGPMIASSHSVATAICPAAFHHRFTSPGLYKSALGYVTTQYSIVTNASGVCGMVVQVDKACSASGFFKLYNGSDFDPSTGSQTTVITVDQKGPFSDMVSAVNQFRIVQMSIEVQPAVSFNTPGIITMGYYTSLSTSNASMLVNQSDVRTFPFNTGGSVKGIYRMVTPFSNISELEFQPTTGSTTDGFVLFATGMGGAVTLNLVINSVIEFVPTKAYFPICPTDYPEPGPQTFALITQLFARFPVLQQLTTKDAYKVATLIYERTKNYQEMIDLISEALSGITHQAAPLVGSSELAMFEGAGPIMAFE